ncbi:MAG TPA: prolyl oligopeptidase family serine peptidase [Micropepsaceae bacterium]|nr:prolyl oligopeptidase family serine peptidase [Micropepsaceae bacterium]
MGTDSCFDRRTVLLATLASVVPGGFVHAQVEVTRPVVSETDCPLEIITPIANDGYRGVGVLRKPPGGGPFPAIIFLPAGFGGDPLSRLQTLARDTANASRFLAAGYVIVVPGYRSRDVDPQTIVSLEDSLAAVEYVRKLPYVDSDSIVVFGCSGGGDLALEVAARISIAAVVPEEPASTLMSGLFNASIPKRGERYTANENFFLFDNPRQYYTTEFQKILRAKVAKIQCPILIVQGDVDRSLVAINRFNADVLIPELRAAGKRLTVRIYPGEVHCFCMSSGLPWPPGLRMQPPGSWSSDALDAFRDIDAFCRRYLKTQPKQINSGLVTYVAVR